VSRQRVLKTISRKSCSRRMFFDRRKFSFLRTNEVPPSCGFNVFPDSTGGEVFRYAKNQKKRRKKIKYNECFITRRDVVIEPICATVNYTFGVTLFTLCGPVYAQMCVRCTRRDGVVQSLSLLFYIDARRNAKKRRFSFSRTRNFGFRRAFTNSRNHGAFLFEKVRGKKWAVLEGERNSRTPDNIEAERIDVSKSLFVFLFFFL